MKEWCLVIGDIRYDSSTYRQPFVHNQSRMRQADLPTGHAGRIVGSKGKKGRTESTTGAV